MTSSSATGSKTSPVTWIGLFIALFGILIVRWAVSVFYPGFSFSATLWKESLIWLCVIALLLIVRRGERLPFSSIGIGTSTVAKSILWGGITLVLCGVVGSGIAMLTHFHGGEMGAGLAKLPLWLVLLVVLRAGVVEELFYRGYAIERLHSSD
jgi:membrane protease YdiL (CAAX protease family)